MVGRSIVQARPARVIAFYLPQFHPIPENDEWWGPGFSEWTNVARARPLFPGHYQPNLPGELGFYDLRLAETRIEQARLAQTHGIEGFCYWHYWLGGGRRLLERPFNEVLESGKPDFPFCLGWANHPWTGVWFGSDDILAEQNYPGLEDDEAHFTYLLKAFSDRRYITVEGKPIFYVHRPRDIPNSKRLANYWRERALSAGLPGLHLVGEGLAVSELEAFGFDGCSYSYHRKIESEKPRSRYLRWLVSRYRFGFNRPAVYSYSEAKASFLRAGESPINEYPSIVANWDSTPRLGAKGVVLRDPHPTLFREHVREALNKVAYKPSEHRILFAKSWNEWAEGNYLEPDRRFGRAFLEVLRDEVSKPDFVEREDDVKHE